MRADAATAVRGSVLTRIDRALASAEQAIASSGLLLALGISLFAIVMRAFRKPTGEWVLELPVELLLVIAVFGAGAVLGRHAHMRVGFLVARMPRPVARATAAFVEAFLAVISGLLTSRAILAAEQTSRAGLSRHGLFGVPEAALIWLSAVGFAFWTFHAVVGLVTVIRTGPHHDSMEGAFPTH